MSKHNFQCLRCGYKFTELRFSISYAANEVVYKVKDRFLECPDCKALEVDFIKNYEGFCTNFGKFSSLSNEDKKKILKKRSRDHSETKLKERKRYLDNNFTGKTRDVDFQSNN